MKLEPTRLSPPASAPLPSTVHNEAALAPVAATLADEERQRSLREELDAVEALSVGDFQGSELILEQAQALAQRIIAESPQGLLRPNAPALSGHIDDTA